MHLLKYFLKCLEINTKIVLSSDICAELTLLDNKILNVLKKLNATKYISGTGTGSVRYVKEQDFLE